MIYSAEIKPGDTLVTPGGLLHVSATCHADYSPARHHEFPRRTEHFCFWGWNEKGEYVQYATKEKVIHFPEDLFTFDEDSGIIESWKV